MKSKIRTIIGAVVVTVAAMILVSCLWSLEEKATQSLEEKAISAAEQENWELAYSYAEEADKSGSTEMLSEIGYRNAEKALQSGEYLSAQEQFEALGAFRTRRSVPVNADIFGRIHWKRQGMILRQKKPFLH